MKFYNRHEFSAALPYLSSLLSIVMTHRGQNCLEAASILKSLGCCHYESQNYKESIVARKEAIRIWEANGSKEYENDVKFAKARIKFTKSHHNVSGPYESLPGVLTSVSPEEQSLLGIHKL
eukprot:CAMPEP_0113314544 /NCGR_PEP_ID=MMETSP0010_2-20120614/10559_1 /TAXON_ID=216773 ORGANISM="Corethron hystrix, Strain 308" /NCGR_SAMPLE_ID=MMETSP0010_2 /ASSEMBLY_ACC=CAM_ASM_000155 /LENGTH=120 /DNA_ID=CAMNT_0000170845 /DNA_START=278 /DNA_END=640 /DNA_ORIENTATION=+ /assembly_acc=CAM_ASM_000155